MTPQVLLLSCEHGGAQVPTKYRHLFEGRSARRALAGHRGSDLGALQVARYLQRSLGVPLHASTVTRLLVDLNRSPNHPRLFSEFSKSLDPDERAALLAQHYFPHRDAVEFWIDHRVRRGKQVLHVGVHSFSPRVNGQVRTADIGLLYDPARPSERELCGVWKKALRDVAPELRVRRNYPYLGKADGLVTHLRERFSESSYAGIELELNQALLETPRGKRSAQRSIAESLRAATP